MYLSDMHAMQQFRTQHFPSTNGHAPTRGLWDDHSTGAVRPSALGLSTSSTNIAALASQGSRDAMLSPRTQSSVPISQIAPSIKIGTRGLDTTPVPRTVTPTPPLYPASYPKPPTPATHLTPNRSLTPTLVPTQPSSYTSQLASFPTQALQANPQQPYLSNTQPSKIELGSQPGVGTLFAATTAAVPTQTSSHRQHTPARASTPVPASSPSNHSSIPASSPTNHSSSPKAGALWSKASPCNGEPHRNNKPLEGIDEGNKGDDTETDALSDNEGRSSEEWLAKAVQYQKGGKFKYAIYCCSKAISVNRSSVDAFVARMDCLMDLDKINEAVSDANAILALREYHIPTYVKRAKCLVRSGRVSEAVEDLQYARHLATYSGGVDELLEEFSGDLETYSRILHSIEAKDHYLALAVPPHANIEVIKKAYKDMCLKWHPDRWANAHPKEQDIAQTCFKECNYAYQVLKDPPSRSQYDFYLDRRRFDPTMPHPSDAPHHYSYNAEAAAERDAMLKNMRMQRQDGRSLGGHQNIFRSNPWQSGCPF